MESWAPNSASSEERFAFPSEDVGVKVRIVCQFWPKLNFSSYCWSGWPSWSKWGKWGSAEEVAGALQWIEWGGRQEELRPRCHWSVRGALPDERNQVSQICFDWSSSWWPPMNWVKRPSRRTLTPMLSELLWFLPRYGESSKIFRISYSFNWSKFFLMTPCQWGHQEELWPRCHWGRLSFLPRWEESSIKHIHSHGVEVVLDGFICQRSHEEELWPQWYWGFCRSFSGEGNQVRYIHSNVVWWRVFLTA